MPMAAILKEVVALRGVAGLFTGVVYVSASVLTPSATAPHMFLQ